MSTWKYGSNSWRVVATDQENRALASALAFWKANAPLGANCSAVAFLVAACGNPSLTELDTVLVNPAGPVRSSFVLRRHSCANCGGVMVCAAERFGNG